MRPPRACATITSFMFNLKEARFWIWVSLFFLALLAGVFGDTSHTKFLAWPYMDKLAHLLYMGALATLLSRRWKMWPVVITGTVLAVAIEILQNWTPPRSPDINDALWGIAGTWFAWGLYQTKWWRELLEKKIF